LIKRNWTLASSAVVSISEELKAAKAAKAAINALLTATPKSGVVATLRKASQAAILNLSSGEPLNEARANAGITLSSLIHGTRTPEKIEKAKGQILWRLYVMRLLERAAEELHPFEHGNGLHRTCKGSGVGRWPIVEIPPHRHSAALVAISRATRWTKQPEAAFPGFISGRSFAETFDRTA
jgi:hypothetical protein